MHKRHFTLVELMAAMLVLVIMMGFLFKFITSSQDLWSASERNSRVYENAQIFFELVDRDLGGAMVNDIPGQEIGFWVGDPMDSSNDLLTMVSTMPPLVADEADVCEVHYRLVPIMLPSPPHPANTSGPTSVLERAVVYQRDTDATKPWDFYGKDTSGLPAPAWWATAGAASNWKEVIDGVEDVVMYCYDPTNPAADPVKHTLPKSAAYLTMPKAVQFTITLVDQKTVDTASQLGMTGTALNERLAPSRRQFTKVVFLNR